MGSCCSAENNGQQKTADLVTLGSKNLSIKSLAAIVKAQACFRGLLVRKEIKKVYGFECKTVGMINRNRMKNI
jgi:hypothetical protein